MLRFCLKFRFSIFCRITQEAQAYAEYLAENDLFEHCPRGGSCNPDNDGENLAYAGGHTAVETNATLRW